VDAAALVVGLGNADPDYRDTRHNVGHLVVERLAERLGARFGLLGPAVVAEARWADRPLLLAKPLTFMNVVGPAVARLLGLLALAPDALVVVHDDLDLPYGTVRVRHRGRAAGHNGLRSLIDALGTDAFRRVKVGIGRPERREDVVDWVLGPFTAAERDDLPAVVERAAEAALALAGSRA
jgi:PTH1 family peptidyl-tRNA hydrolase